MDLLPFLLKLHNFLFKLSLLLLFSTRNGENQLGEGKEEENEKGVGSRHSIEAKSCNLEVFQSSIFCLFYAEELICCYFLCSLFVGLL